jgi:RNA polymerase sigma-70 factor (ECF subfamily)
MNSKSPQQKQSRQPIRDNAAELLLIGRVATRDRTALEVLYKSYAKRLARFLDRVTRRQDLVDEAINDTFWIVWKSAPDFRGDSQVSTWVIGIAYRCTLKALRRSGLLGSDQIVPSGEICSDFDPFVDNELTNWVACGLQHLPVEQRVTIELAYYLGHSLAEISSIMDCPVSTVKARMFHARMKLRNILPRLAAAESGTHHE